MDFGDTPDELKEEYLEVYEDIQSEILNTTRFDENSHLSTTYVGKVDISKNNRRGISYKRTRAYNGKVARWNRMPSFVRYRT